jgi:hypothetical protein
MTGLTGPGLLVVSVFYPTVHLYLEQGRLVGQSPAAAQLLKLELFQK